MPSYSNGYVPEHLLVTFKTGWNKTDGNWKHQLSPSTYRKHQRMVELARRRTGRTLEISEGWGAYRPYNIQVIARNLYGNGAAWPGTSSHGGFWENKQTLAIDYANWGWVYDWNRDAFYADVRTAGLVPGLIHPSRGNNYPDEPWHVVDLDPWAPVPAGNKVAAPETVVPVEQEDEDEDMSKNVLYTTTEKGKYPIRAAVSNDLSGLWIELVDSKWDTVNKLADRYQTGDKVEVSASMFKAARNAAAQVRPQTNLAVTVGEPDA